MVTPATTLIAVIQLITVSGEKLASSVKIDETRTKSITNTQKYRRIISLKAEIRFLVAHLENIISEHDY